MAVFPDSCTGGRCHIPHVFKAGGLQEGVEQELPGRVGNIRLLPEWSRYAT